MSDVDDRIKAYIDSRLAGYIGYYDKTARRMKRRHLQTRSAAAVGAVLIPVVSNLAWEPVIAGISIHVATVGASLIGVVVALILALEGVFHFKDQWQNFRGTEQYLLSQRCRFENRVDDYQALSDLDAFKLFVSRVENAILDENNVTLNVLGRVEAASTAAPRPARNVAPTVPAVPPGSV
jgi:hypothetical protein